MKRDELINYINSSYFMNLNSVKNTLDIKFKISPYYENTINCKSFGHFNVGTNLYKCEDGFVAIEGMCDNFLEWHEDTVGYCRAIKYEMTT